MATNSNMTIMEQVAEVDPRISPYPEKMLGRGHNQPFNCSNSGARKLLASSQSDQLVPIKEPQLAIVTTGSENQYGDLSSSIVTAEGDYNVVAVIDKYSFKPKYHYWIIFHDLTNNIYRLQESRTHKHITEKHGYHYNIDYMNGLRVGDYIPSGTIIRKSDAYDEYGNRIDGTNITTLYLATEKNTEDSIIVSQSCSKILGTTHFQNTQKIINANARLLDLYGKSDAEYKSFPDIGENTVNGIFCSIRTTSKEEELYTCTRNKLKQPLMSDDSVIISGRVVDIDVRCNDPEQLEAFYNVQVKKYYNESMRVYAELVEACNQIMDQNPHAVFEYSLEQMYYTAQKALEGVHCINDGREFNNIYMDITIEQDVALEIGDKCADRYGGKGVISLILPDELMPIDDMGNKVQMIVNSSTCVNRENPGQLFETSLTYISSRIVRFISETELHKTSPREAIGMVLKFYEIVSPLQYEYMVKWLESITDESYLESYINSIVQDEFIYMSLRPIQDNMTEDKLEQLYKEFPFIDQTYLQVPIIDSNGNPRFVQSRRKAIAAKKYMYRLKQFSEDKFSATSLSATNIKNLNTKSKAYKRYKAAHSNTPIAMGTMESDDLSSVGQEFVISNLMINSVSPMGRRLMKQALVGDPFELDIQLDDNCANRNVEIVNAYQKTKGVALRFKKYPKKRIAAVSWREQRLYVPELVKRLDDDPERTLALYEKNRELRANDKNIVRSILVSEITEEEMKERLKEMDKANK